MTLALIVISFLASLAFTLALRRLDKPGNKLAQIKRLGELQTHSLEEMARTQVQSIRDASLDFEVMIRQSKTQQNELRQELSALQEKIGAMQEDRKVIENISSEINEIASGAATVSEQVERLDMGLSRLGYAQKEIAEIQLSIRDVNHALTQKGVQAEDKLNEIISRLVNETEERTGRLTEEVRASFEILDKDGRSMHSTIDSHKQEAEIIKDRLNGLDGQLDEKWSLENGRLEEKFSGLERGLQERSLALETGLASIRSTAVDAIREETTRIRADLDNFNLEAISKRDDILNETRRMAEGMGEKIEIFQEKYLDAENKLQKHIETITGSLNNKLEDFSETWSQKENTQLEFLEDKIKAIDKDIENVRRKKISDYDKETEEFEGNIRGFFAEEEENLEAMREEMASLRDNLTLLGHELKAAVRSEGDHHEARLKENSQEQEEYINNLGADLRKKIEAFNREGETLLGRIEKNRDDFHENAEAVQGELEATREAANTEVLESAEAVKSEFIETADSYQGEINESFENAAEKLTIISRNTEEKVTNVSEKARNEMSEMVATTREGLSEKAREIRQDIGDLAENVREDVKETVASFKKESHDSAELVGDSLKETRTTMNEFRKEGLKEFEKALDARFNGLEEIRSSLIKDLEKNVENFMAQQDGKLERQDRELEDKITRQITLLADRGQLQLDELQKRTESTLRETVGTLESELEEARREFSDVREAIAAETIRMEEVKDQVFGEFEDTETRLAEFQEKLAVVDRADSLVTQLDETVEVLSDRLQLAVDENSKMDDIVRNFETLRFSRKELESELKLIESQRGRLNETGKQFTSMESRLEELLEKFGELKEMEETAGNLEERKSELLVFQDSFEKFFADLGDRKKFLESAVRYIENSRKQATEAGDNADALNSTVERAELRQEDLGDQLGQLEKRAIALTRLDKDIQKVESRFEQMEGLMLDLENKQKQIGAMGRKADDIKKHNENLKDSMEHMLTEADEKMEHMSAFFQTIGDYVEQHDDAVVQQPVAVGAGARESGGLSDLKKNGILSLYLNHKWEPDLIAERMKLEPAMVRAVIKNSGR